MLRLKKTVILVGMMGSGKTTVGHALSRLLDVPFVDVDGEIVRSEGCSIADIFNKEGESFFRAVESKILKRVLSGLPMVVSTGGGAFLSEHNRLLIKQKGVSVCLDAELDVLWERVRYKKTRPLLQTSQPYETLKKLFEDRVGYYHLSDIKVSSSNGASPALMAKRVLIALQNFEGVIDESPE